MNFLHTRKSEREVLFLEHLDDGRLEEGKFGEERYREIWCMN